MKVIFVIANMGGGGSERVIANLANDFLKKEIKVAILMTASNEVAYELHPNIEVIALGNQTYGNVWKRLKRLFEMRNYFKKDSKAAIISFGTETNLFTIVATRFLPNKVIVSERNDPNKCTYKKLRDIIYLRADNIVFQTEDAKKHFRESIRVKGTIIGNPISNEICQPYIGVREKKIVAVGRLTEQKNYYLLLNAFSVFHKSHQEFILMIYGKGELEEELRQYVKKLDLDKYIIFKGFQDDVLQKIKGAAMYVLSSNYEGISNSLTEAMAIGIPVISTDCPIGGSKMLIRNEENGLLIPMNNIEKLAEAMMKIADDNDFAEQLSKDAVRVRQEFSLEKISNKWIELFQENKELV